MFTMAAPCRCGGGGRFALAGRRPPTLQAGTCPFEGAGERFDGRVQHVCHLVGMESEDVAQDEDGELAGRQDLQCRDEGQGDGFGLLVAGLRPERQVGGALEDCVRRGLQPGGLVARRRIGRSELRHVPPAGRAPGSPRGAR